MTNSWEWVEKHNRQERVRKRFRLAGIIMMVLFMLSVFGIPKLIKPQEEETPLGTDVGAFKNSPPK